MKALIRTGMVLAVIGLLLAGSAWGSDLTIVNYTLVSSERVSRVEYEYTYKADMTNTGSDIKNVMAHVTSNSPYTTVVEGILDFGDILAGTTETSTNTFSIKHNRRYPLDWSALEWDIQHGELVRVCGPEGGTFEVDDSNSAIFGASVEIPEGALSEEKIISIRIGSPQEPLYADLMSAGAFLSFGPDGTSFNAVVTITMPYSDVDQDGFVDGTQVPENKVGVIFFNEMEDKWINLTVLSRDEDQNIVKIQSKHFSSYVPYVILGNPPNMSLYRGVSFIDPRAIEKCGEDQHPTIWHVEDDLQQIRDHWNANIVRIPITPSDWEDHKDDYVQKIDELIEKAKEINTSGGHMAIIIDWHAFGDLSASYLDDSGTACWKDKPSECKVDDPPEWCEDLFYNGNKASLEDTINFWEFIADKYKETHSPMIFYEIFNEPVGIAWQYPWWLRWLGIKGWSDYAEEIVRAIREIDSQKTILVSGVNWGYDLRGVMYKRIPFSNIVYVSHPYPEKTIWPFNTQQSWYLAFGQVADPQAGNESVFVTEWGFDPTGENGPPYLGTVESYGTHFVEYLSQYNIGWTAWSFSKHWYPSLLEEWILGSKRWIPRVPYGSFVKCVLSNDWVDTDGDGVGDTCSSASNPIMLGPKTVGVTSPENAFDGDLSTYANIPWYWGEGGHQDFLHFISKVNSNTFEFKIRVRGGTVGSYTIDLETAPDNWVPIETVVLDSDKTVKISISNAEKYLDPGGYISLRARWTGGWNWHDSLIFEIWAPNLIPSIDVDVDGILDDGDGSGVIGDALCTGGNTVGCDDNCADLNNSDQADTDGDGIGNICDNCQYHPNDDQLDSNGDGVGDACSNVVHPIMVGPKTIGVTAPQQAIDGNLSTYANIPWYWGEGGHHDFFHFISPVYSNTFVFHIRLRGGTVGSYAIDLESTPNNWTTIKTIGLGVDQTVTITVPNAWSYVDASGNISLRARWMNGWRMQDSLIYEIWSYD